MKVIEILNITKFSKRRILIVLLISLVAIITISMVSAADITISNTTSGGLKKAIETAENGDRICLKNGVYVGQNNTNITISKNIRILGLGSKVVLDGKGKNQILQINKKNVKVSLKNIKFTNGQNKKIIINQHGYETIGGDGGAISNSGYLTIANCIFTNNEVGSFGGAIENLGHLNIKNCKFRDNKAVAGGAICSYSKGTLTISSSTFTNNWAYNGGAILCEGSSIRSSIFTSNRAGWDGAISHYKGKNTVRGCIFKNNKANFGGGAIGSRDNSVIISCTFTNNKATKDDGGAIYTYPKSTCKIENSKFTKNTATSFGGAISCYGKKLTISSSTFTNNKAGKKGGAICNYGKSKIENSKFTKNIAGKRYNALFEPYKITLKNVKIIPKD